MNKQKNNNGFTLIELIIAIAILAFLMTAVSSFMGTGVLSFKKAKADITVHTSAQDVYDSLTDGIMSANNLIIYGYVAKGTMSGTSTGELDFSQSGSSATTELDGPYYFVRDDEQKAYLKSGSYTVKDSSGTETTTYYSFDDEYDGTSDVYTYSELAEKAPNAKIYVKKIIVERAKTIDIDTLTASQSATVKNGKDYYKNNFESGGGKDIIYLMDKQQEQSTITLDTDGTELISQSGKVVESSGGDVYVNNDTERIIISFNEECMYYETEYAFQTTLNDSYRTNNTSAGSTPSFKNTDYTNSSYANNMSPYVYSESLSYLTEVKGTGSDNTATGCVATLDVDGGAVQFDLYFSDKNMTYTTLGMVNIRNNYVLKAKQ